VIDASLIVAYVCSVIAWVSGAVLYEQVASEDITIALPVFISSVIGCTIATWIVAANWFKRQHRVEELERDRTIDAMELKRLRAELDELRKKLTP
jgi:hypothetical protein